MRKSQAVVRYSSPARGYQAAWAIAVALLLALAMCSSSWAQLRVVNYNIAKLNGNTAALEYVLAALHDDDKPGFAVPVSVFVFQEVRSTDLDGLTNVVNAAAPSGVAYTRATYTSSSAEDMAGGAQAMFYRTGMFTENAAAHMDINTGGGARKSDRWQLRLAGYNSPLAWMYVYSSHLKADTGAANQQERLDGVTLIRANADALGANLHVIYCGDYNFYNNNEPGYLHFFTNGNGQAVDPLGTGSWAGGNSAPNNANNIKHTQSPVFTAVGGLTGGGMDDRFDQQLSTSAFHDGAGLSIIPNTYRAFGNDGLKWKLAIDNGNNFYYPGQLARSNALATNLRLASDHVPLIVDYQIPARLSGSIPANYGRVIVGTVFHVQAQISNSAAVDYAIGADVLNFSATGTLGLSGTVPGSAQPLGTAALANFPLNTTTAAIRNGTVTVTSSSQGVQPGSIVLNTTGTVVRRSNPSFSSTSNVVKLNLPLEYGANTGVHNFSVNVFNRGFDALQATLDIDAISGVAPPFAYMSGIATGIGAGGVTLNFAFDTTGLAPGLYSAPIELETSDEDIPGEAMQLLNLNVAVTLNGPPPPNCVADIAPPGPPMGDGVVGVPDLLMVISNWGACPVQPNPCPADIAPNGGDGMVGVPDLLAVISNWGPCQ